MPLLRRRAQSEASLAQHARPYIAKRQAEEDAEEQLLGHDFTFRGAAAFFRVSTTAFVPSIARRRRSTLRLI